MWSLHHFCRKITKGSRVKPGKPKSISFINGASNNSSTKIGDPWCTKWCKTKFDFFVCCRQISAQVWIKSCRHGRKEHRMTCWNWRENEEINGWCSTREQCSFSKNFKQKNGIHNVPCSKTVTCRQNHLANNMKSSSFHMLFGSKVEKSNEQLIQPTFIFSHAKTEKYNKSNNELIWHVGRGWKWKRMSCVSSGLARSHLCHVSFCAK